MKAAPDRLFLTPQAPAASKRCACLRRQIHLWQVIDTLRLATTLHNTRKLCLTPMPLARIQRLETRSHIKQPYQMALASPATQSQPSPAKRSRTDEYTGSSLRLRHTLDLSDPRINTLCQHIQRHRTTPQHHIMKCSEIEPGTEHLLSLSTQP